MFWWRQYRIGLKQHVASFVLVVNKNTEGLYTLLWRNVLLLKTVLGWKWHLEMLVSTWIRLLSIKCFVPGGQPCYTKNNFSCSAIFLSVGQFHTKTMKVLKRATRLWLWFAVLEGLIKLHVARCHLWEGSRENTGRRKQFHLSLCSWNQKKQELQHWAGALRNSYFRLAWRKSWARERIQKASR